LRMPTTRNEEYSFTDVSSLTRSNLVASVGNWQPVQQGSDAEMRSWSRVGAIMILNVDKVCCLTALVCRQLMFQSR
jgi:hypothetical protein